MSTKPIVLRAKAIEEGNTGVVRLSPEAERVVRRLHARTGLTIRQIVSDIIIQSECLITIDLSYVPED